MDSVGYVGTVEVETNGVARLWFGLTEKKEGDDWLRIGAVRAWFSMDLESVDRPFFMAQLPLLMEAMRSGLQVKVSHSGAASYKHSALNDAFAVVGVRILRSGLGF